MFRYHSVLQPSLLSLTTYFNNTCKIFVHLIFLAQFRTKLQKKKHIRFVSSLLFLLHLNVYESCRSTFSREHHLVTCAFYVRYGVCAVQKLPVFVSLSDLF